MRVGPQLATLLRATATDARSAGVPLDPTDRSTLLVIGQLLFGEIDWDDPELLSKLNVVGLGGWKPEGGWDLVTSTLGHTEDDHRLLAIRRLERKRAGSAYARRAYAGGKTRQQRSSVKEMKKAIDELKESFPNVTATQITTTWNRGEDTPGGCLRVALQLRQYVDDPPSESTLNRHLRRP
jgi:hypothetical protein